MTVFTYLDNYIVKVEVVTTIAVIMTIPIPILSFTKVNTL